jgi:hypothetical protein
MAMFRIRGFLGKSLCVSVLGLGIFQSQTARAGWTGLINGAGFGWASVNVRSSTSVSNKVATPSVSGPSASIAPTAGYTYVTNSPSGASANTYSRIKGLAGGIWQAKTAAAVGDGADNPELEARVSIVPANCASLSMDTSINQQDFNANGNSGTIQVNATATAGTALWLRGFEYTGDPNLLPPDDPNTVENETVEYLKAHGVWRFENVLLGPFDYSGSNSSTCPLLIPFTLTTSNLNNLYFAADGVAKTVPFIIECPSDVTFKCGDTVKYPPTMVSGGCGTNNGTWSPTEDYHFPIGVTPVTVTATDEAGNTTSCSFKVTITDSTAPVPPPLPTLTGESSVTVPVPPPVTDNCGGIVIGTTKDPLVYNTQGTFTVHWSFDDGNGNVSTANQTVIVHDDIPPSPPTRIPDATGECSVTVTPPTAVDNVAGNVVGTTSDPKVYTAQGNYVVHWSFNDGNGNISMANQNVIVKDVTPPAKPVLKDLTYSLCSGPAATPPTPTTTDNCKGTVSGTTTTSFPITTVGTNVVTWTFNDGNGNSTTATQKIIVTGLTFVGFYAPINGLNGTCSSPQCVQICGNTIPIKFDMKCGSSYVKSGTAPVVKIQSYSNNCVQTAELVSANAVYQNGWCYNWNTSKCAKGIYRVVVVLPDGTTSSVFIRLKLQSDN